RRTIASGLQELKQVVERALIEGRDHRLSNVGEEVIDAEACTWKRIHPIVFEQTANDEFQEKVGEVAHMYMILVQPECHPGRAPVDRHAHQSEESDTAQLSETELRQHPAILRGKVRQIVG